MAQHNLKLVQRVETKRFFVQVVTENQQPNHHFEIHANTLPKARREALEYLDTLEEGQGWVELYERAGGPSAAPLLIWVGVV